MSDNTLSATGIEIDHNKKAKGNVIPPIDYNTSIEQDAENQISEYEAYKETFLHVFEMAIN